MTDPGDEDDVRRRVGEAIATLNRACTQILRADAELNVVRVSPESTPAQRAYAAHVSAMARLIREHLEPPSA